MFASGKILNNKLNTFLIVVKHIIFNIFAKHDVNVKAPNKLFPNDNKNYKMNAL